MSDLTLFPQSEDRIPKMSSGEVYAALATRYSAPEYAFLREVPNSTGSASRRADALAMGLWRSRGLYLTGFEVKVSRSDWLNEYRKPEKADLIAKYCDFWYLVVGDEKIIKEGELPLNWGLLVPHGNKCLKVKKEAVKMEPEPIDRKFLAALLRKVHESSSDAGMLSAAVDKAKQDAYRRGYDEAMLKSGQDLYKRKFDDLAEKVKNFQELSGVNISREWRLPNISQAVKFIADGGMNELDNALESVKDRAESLIKKIEYLKNGGKEDLPI